MRILLVDDERHLVETIRQGLIAENCVVEVAFNGHDGLVRATDNQFDVVVLDVMLPGLNGYEVVRQLRARRVWTPVLMLTAKDGEYDEADAFDLGADDYLTKPFSFVVLVARLRALQRRGAPARPVTLRAGWVTLDPARRKVWSGGAEIALTPREFGLLEFLLRRAGEVVGKEEILRGVWDSYFAGSDNVVEVYVGYLRRKLGSGVIETVRGAGYRLIVEDSGSDSS